MKSIGDMVIDAIEEHRQRLMKRIGDSDEYDLYFLAYTHIEDLVRQVAPAIQAEYPVSREEISKAGFEGREVRFRIGGRLFAIRELPQ